MNKKKSKLSIIRTIIQILVFVGVFLITLNSFLGEKGVGFLPAISTHNTCPFGGLETAYTWFTTGIFVSKVHSSSLVLFFIGLVVVVLFGALFCGFICPFGTMQEWVGKVGKKIFPKKYNNFIPNKIDKFLRFLRYFFLIKILYETTIVGKLIFEANDPYYALMNFYNSEVLSSAFAFLAITLILSLFVERPFCKYVCPYGAVLGLLGRFSIFKVRRNASTCINCGKCDKVCPMNIEVSAQTAVVGHHCISCYKCISGEACPIENTLIISTSGNMKSEVTSNEN